MTEVQDGPEPVVSTGDAPDADVPAQRYTAELATEIELAWQQRWAEAGTFDTPNPSGELSAGFDRVAIRPHTYILDMFPYPSGAGLHVGHPLGFIGTDVHARFLRMRGDNVLHAMGFDAFGLPAEQYAVETGTHPAVTTNANIEVYRAQLRRLGLAHDNRRTLATTDPGYYRWTQWIFLQIFNSYFDRYQNKARPIADLIAELDAGTRPPDAGANPFDREWAELSPVERRQVIDNHRLAYRAEAMVNWAPGLGTVVANEEVTSDGRSERGNFPVFRRPLPQWMMRITAYADRLIDDLDHIDWPDKVRAMQRNWIGRSQGAHVDFATDAGPLRVFTTRPDTLFGATYMVIAPEHPMATLLTPDEWPEGTNPAWTEGAPTPKDAVAGYQARTANLSDLARQSTETKDKTGVFTGGYATNPVNGARIPVFVADYVLMGYGTGAIMAVPAQDERDWDFATKFELPIVRTVDPGPDWDGAAFTGDGPAINSTHGELSLDGLGVAEAKVRIIAWLEEHEHGQGTTTYRLRDWLFSRQRYWGEPFPIVFDETGLPVAVPESLLPVELPDTDRFSPTAFDPEDVESEPQPPLARLTDWVEVELDLGDGPKKYRRETNTMPQWAGSCWYELRYTDPNNDQSFVDPALEHYWMGPTADRPMGGVGLYVGGVEHAVLHLLYARFWHKVLFDLGHVSSAEPFHRLINQGYVSAYAYQDERGFYVPAAEVVESVEDGRTTYTYQGQPVTRSYGKMGKSLKNVTTPDEMFEQYGADTLRLFEMAGGPLEQDRPWDTRGAVGPYRLLQRLWRVVVDEHTGAPHVSDDPVPDELNRLLHRTIDSVREGYETLRFNTSIARLTELNNAVRQAYPDRGHAACAGRGDGADAGPAGAARGRGAVVPAGARAVAGLARVPGGRCRAAGGRHRGDPGPGERQAALGGGRGGRRRRRGSGGCGPRGREGRRCVGRGRGAAGHRQARPTDQLRRLTSWLRRPRLRSSPTRPRRCRRVRADVAVVPLRVHLGPRTAVDGVEVDVDAVVAALRERQPVSTSRPNPSEFAAAYRSAFAAGASHVVSIHLAAALSGTWESAVLASQDFEYGRVRVVDSRSAGMGLGYAVAAAADVAAGGGTPAEVQEAAVRVVDRLQRALLRRLDRSSAARGPAAHGQRPARHVALGQAAAEDGGRPDRAGGEGPHQQQGAGPAGRADRPGLRGGPGRRRGAAPGRARTGRGGGRADPRSGAAPGGAHDQRTGTGAGRAPGSGRDRDRGRAPGLTDPTAGRRPLIRPASASSRRRPAPSAVRCGRPRRSASPDPAARPRR